MLAAMIIWGFSPLYYAQLSGVPALEIIVHRVLWSLPLVLAYALLSGRRARLAEVARSRGAVLGLGLSAAMVTCNWVVFVWAIQLGRTNEASLGYFIYPLMSVILGALLFREGVTRLQWLAAGIAGCAVLWLGIRVGTPPWIAMSVAATFTAYGLIRKVLSTGPMIGVIWEMMLIAPLLGLWLAWKGGGVFGEDIGVSLLLIGSSFFTALPLILFVEAAKALPYSTVGILFYLNPGLQLVSAFILGEVIGSDKLIAFGAILIAVALYCRELVRTR